MLIKTVFAGFGGQGVLMMGYIFAHAVMTEEKNVTFMPSYGAEVRGGTANCTVAVSNEEIASPIASSPEYAVIMNAQSLDRFQSSVKGGGLMFINSTMVTREPSRTDVGVVNVPASAMAEELGDLRIANIYMLGAYVAGTGLVSPRTVADSLRQVFSGKKQALVDLNIRALEAGMEYLRANYPERAKKKSKVAAT
jgi:2-oxoglutarate ferredoxin oxidoreductase subunit gamma